MRGLGNKSILAKNLRRLMQENDVSEKELSKTLKFPYTTVLSWLNAVNYPRIDKIEMMANYFGVQKSVLIEEWKETEPAENDGVSGKRKMLIDYAKSLSEEEAAMALRVLRSIVESD